MPEAAREEMEKERREVRPLSIEEKFVRLGGVLAIATACTTQARPEPTPTTEFTPNPIATEIPSPTPEPTLTPTPEATPTPEFEVAKIPEEIFPIYGTFLGYTENNQAGLLLLRLPQPQPREVEYLLLFQKNTGGQGQIPRADDIYTFNVFEPEPGTYRQTPDTERVTGTRLLPIIEVKSGEEEGQLEGKLIIPVGTSQLTYEFTLTFQGTGKEMVYETLRDMVEKMASTTLNDRAIRDILRNQKIELA